ncbi:hypothetical protein V495_07101 [Pseudogymnoascus sp. VKM F-4514 (FW-929)]|nr:hypothetical protein V495_07101 [Pseudogymnoascus sp. VKM F-4514 (FW-929)]
MEWFNLSVYKYGPVFGYGLLARNGVLLWRSRGSDKLWHALLWHASLIGFEWLVGGGRLEVATLEPLHYQ